jgi:hypothetical protein
LDSPVLRGRELGGNLDADWRHPVHRHCFREVLMTTYQLIQMMANRHFFFECGPHEGCSGFFASFYKKPASRPGWSLCGHGLTLHRAIIMAVKIATGRTVHVPPIETFATFGNKHDSQP